MANYLKIKTKLICLLLVPMIYCIIYLYVCIIYYDRTRLKCKILLLNYELLPFLRTLLKNLLTIY